ncbi:MAG: phospho-sugar mutase, partial [Simkania negevensis]|nr:phospho-sugar mutase [Simkania negevensis]
MDPLIKKEIEKWLHPPYDIATQEAVKKLLKENPQELADSFNGTIEFGTGGMRGKMGVGTNRLNSYTIQKATQGLANYILKTPPSLERHRIFISYDSRNHSRLFAQETAQVLAANGMEAYLTKELRPTPFVSFACRYLKCTAAVMITASHNPPEYNGYKVYWSDGAQVVFPHDQAIISEVKKIKSIETIKRAPFSHPLIHQVGSTIDEAYYAAIEKLQTFPEKNRDFGPKLHLLYSNLHGTGITLLPEAIRRWGFTSLSFVEEEKEPDGSFPNTSSPNPEQKETLKVGIDKLKQEKKDLFFATDPDADRLGVVVMHKNNPVILNGNQIAVICLFYLLKNLSKLGKLPSHSACI